MVEVIVEYDYEAVQQDELTIRVGDIIRNVAKLEEDGWCEGELNGKSGFFPDNFVKEIKKDGEAKEENLLVKREKTGNVASLVQRMSTYRLPTGGIQPHPKSLRKRKSKKRQCEVTFDYIPQNEDELELKLGDVVEIIDEEEEGWWRGILNDKVGMFPSNFVTELMDQVEDAETNEMQNELEVGIKDFIGVGPLSPTSPLEFSGNESPVGTGATVQPKKVRGVGFGDIFKEGSVKLKSRLSNSDSLIEEKKPEKQPTSVSTAEPVKKAEPENKQKVKEYCKALFSYEATNDDELNITEGDQILLIHKDTGDKGWWKGESNGKQGLFPDNFVVLVSETEREVIAAPKVPAKLPPKPEHDDKPKKPLAPVKIAASKPEPSPAEKKHDLKKPQLDRPEPLSSKVDEKDDHRPVKAAAPAVPPKKPIIPLKGNSAMRLAIPPKRPEKPLLPPPLAKANGEVPYNRPKSDIEPSILRPKHESESSHFRPKSMGSALLDKALEIDLMGFDAVESSSNKLSHLTTSRPKMPRRRPPTLFCGSPSALDESHSNRNSKVIEEEEEEEEEKEEEAAKPKSSTINKKALGESHFERSSKVKEEETAKPKPSIKKSLGESHLDRSSKVIEVEETAKPKLPNSIKKPTLKQNVGPENAVDVKDAVEVDNENRSDLEDLKAQITDLVTVVEQLKSQHKKELNELRNDLEDEKKKRAALQLEIDKLKKAVQST
ncbi:CD2-associated protein isoform X1 [Callorhinchus milii]|nr:CD2-associated protein isoform X1 [Callorhinchus milii]|eukprot:gi/632970186/ref/XP_007901505.1/ PREDICTED: CD2-associated protein [Callorhinchus milii]